jgi:hypothetical protein
MSINFVGWTGKEYDPNFMNQGTKEYAKSKGIDDINRAITAEEAKSLVEQYDSFSINGEASTNTLQRALFNDKFEAGSAAEKAAILTLCNADLLNQMDGSDHNSVFTKRNMEDAFANVKCRTSNESDKPTESPPASPNPTGDKLSIAKNAFLINKDASIHFMDQFETAIKGESKAELDGNGNIKGSRANNGKFGELGLMGLSKLKDYPGILNTDPDDEEAFGAAVDTFLNDPDVANSIPSGANRDKVKEQMASIIKNIRKDAHEGEVKTWSNAAANLRTEVDNDYHLKQALFGNDGAASSDDLRWKVSVPYGGAAFYQWINKNT